MKSTIKILFAALLLASIFQVTPCFGQAVTTQTTTTVAINDTNTTSYVNLASATNVAAGGALFLDGEAMNINSSYSAGSLVVPVTRGAFTTRAVLHASGVKVFVFSPGVQARRGLTDYDHRGACVRTDQTVLPVVNALNGKVFSCEGGTGTGNQVWGEVLEQFVPPTQCTWVPTTLTQTSTYTFAGNMFVLKGISNAAAGTMTLTCNILPPTSAIAQRGAVLFDINLFVASSATGSGVVPTSVGTSTLGSVTFPAAATTETASTGTPVAVGGTVTTTGAGASAFLSAVTTDGTFYTLKHTYASAIPLSTDLQALVYTMPILQSAASVSTLFTPGLLVHYLIPVN